MKWQFCRIEWLPFDQVLAAVIDTPKGREGIKTKQYTDPQKKPEEYSKLVGELLAEGWEPIYFDNDGQAKVFKRPS